MTIGIKVTLQPDQSLLLQANNETRASLAESLRHSYQRAESDLLEMIRGEYINTPSGTCYNLEWLDPADIFALTDMPMFADTVRDDDDRVRVYGPVWGFPDYMLRDYIEELAHKGRTLLLKVADYGEGMLFPSRWGRDKKLAEYIARRAYENCLEPEVVTEQVPDIHSDDPEATLPLIVDIKTASPPPALRDPFAN